MEFPLLPCGGAGCCRGQLVQGASWPPPMLVTQGSGRRRGRGILPSCLPEGLHYEEDEAGTETEQASNASSPDGPQNQSSSNPGLPWQQQDSGALGPVDVLGLEAESEAGAEALAEAQGAVGPGPRWSQR